MGESPAAIGRIPQEVSRVALGWRQPRELATGEVAVAALASEGPAYVVGAALFGHPEAFIGELARRLALRRSTAALAHGRSVLRKLATFVPRSHLESVRDAIAAAGAGFFGAYRDCTFSSEGIGTFLPLDGANPHVGRVGERTYAEEARLESAFPAYRENAVLHALLASHPYQEPAYDIYDLRNPEPTYGAARLGSVEAQGMEQFARKVRGAAGAKEVRWRARAHVVERVLVVGDPRLARIATEVPADAIVAPPLLPWDARALQDAGYGIIEVEDFLPLALEHFAGRLRAQLQLEVRFVPEGFKWRRLRSRDGTRRS